MITPETVLDVRITEVTCYFSQFTLRELWERCLNKGEESGWSLDEFVEAASMMDPEEVLDFCRTRNEGNMEVDLERYGDVVGSISEARFNFEHQSPDDIPPWGSPPLDTLF